MSPDELLRGAIDLHAHGSPEFSVRMPGRVSNLEWTRLATDAGMRGFVMKSHVFPTMGAVNTLASAAPELSVFSSITLNPPAGGLSPLAVELALEAGARMVWMPTWSARQEGSTHGLFLARMKPFLTSLDPRYWPAEGISILDDDAKLKPEVEQILEICATRDVPVASGHLPIRASKVLCARAAAQGVRFVLTHPFGSSVAASLQDQVEIVEAGGVIEHVFIGCMPMHARTDPQIIADAIARVGPENCVLASDAIENWNPPAPEIMRMFLATLQALGVDDNALHLMTHENPAKVLGIDPEWSPRSTGDNAP